MHEVYVIKAMRTAIGKYGGALSTWRPDDLIAQLIKSLINDCPNLNTNDIEEVIIGAANQAGEDNRNVARMAVLLSELPITVAGVTVNRLCASGLQSIMDSFRALRNGDGDVYIAGGVESMTRAPLVIGKANTAWSRNAEIYDTTIGWRFTNPKLSELYPPYAMGETAENVAEKYKITRSQQDEFAFHSQEKYHLAQAINKFKNEIIAIEIKDKKTDLLFSIDEHPRLTSLDQLAALQPAFKKGGTVTAGNSSGINDGAAAMILVSENYLKQNNIKPMARIISVAAAGVDPSIMGMGPVPAVHKVLHRAKLNIEDIDLFELNEAFASQSIACIQELHLDQTKVNVNGGAIALGHPLGASGTRISTTLLHEMQYRKSKYGIATMCVGVGQGAAILYERL